MRREESAGLAAHRLPAIPGLFAVYCDCHWGFGCVRRNLENVEKETQELLALSRILQNRSLLGAQPQTARAKCGPFSKWGGGVRSFSRETKFILGCTQIGITNKIESSGPTQWNANAQPFLPGRCMYVYMT